MSLFVFIAVLCAALLHASWNALVKVGLNRFQTMLVLSIAQGAMGVLMILAFPAPAREAWPFLLATGLVHTAYKLFLAAAYEHGDLSRVYPIARGAAPMMVALMGLLILSDPVSPVQYIGIFLVGAGIMTMARGIFTGGEATKLLPLALASAVCTATYSILDGVGARLSLSPSAFTGWMFFLDGVFFATIALFWKGKDTFKVPSKVWVSGSLAGALSLVSYWIVIWAMTEAPIQLVTALRETSVLFATLIGIIWLKEKRDPSKLVAAALIVAGMVSMRL